MSSKGTADNVAIVAAYRSGQSLRQIAAQHSTSYETVRRILGAAGVEPRAKGPPSKVSRTSWRTIYVPAGTREALRRERVERDLAGTGDTLLAIVREEMAAGTLPTPDFGREVNVRPIVPAELWEQAGEIGAAMSPKMGRAGVLAGLVVARLGA